MNFSERVEIHGQTAGVIEHLGTALRNPFDVAADELYTLACDNGMDMDQEMHDYISMTMHELKRELQDRHSLALNLDFQPKAA